MLELADGADPEPVEIRREGFQVKSADRSIAPRRSSVDQAREAAAASRYVPPAKPSREKPGTKHRRGTRKPKPQGQHRRRHDHQSLGVKLPGASGRLARISRVSGPTPDRSEAGRFPPPCGSLVRTPALKRGYRAWVVGGLRPRSRPRGAARHGGGRRDRCATTGTSRPTPVPEDVMRLFRRVIPTGIKHGTVTVLLGDDSYEVTTLRGETTLLRRTPSRRRVLRR